MRRSLSLLFLVMVCLISIISLVSAEISDEILVESHNRIQVHHIIVKGGTSDDIGYELANVGIAKFGTVLLPFSDPQIGAMKEKYISSIDPYLANKSVGVKKAYGMDLNNTSVDASALIITSLFPSCSVIYFPPSQTTNGHAISGRNADYGWYPLNHTFQNTSPDSPDVVSGQLGRKNYVLEIYPDDGYATIVCGMLDLMNGVSDGLNEKGLVVHALEDDDAYFDPTASFAGGDKTSISSMQALRIVLEHCSTVDEAKEMIQSLDIMTPFKPMHTLIFDASGKATIWEVDNATKQTVFTDYSNEPVSMTNFAVHLKPDVTKLSPNFAGVPYDDVIRGQALHAYITNHTGLYTSDDAWNATKEVEANLDEDPDGFIPDGPMRTVWTVVTDANDRTMTVKYYLEDGKGYDPINKTHELIYSEPFTFQLKR